MKHRLTSLLWTLMAALCCTPTLADDNPWNMPSGLYRLKSDRGGYLYLEGTNPQTSTGKGNVASSVVRLTRTPDGEGYYIKMQDKYLHTPLKSQTMMLSDVPEKFYTRMVSGSDKVAFTTQKGGHSAIHCGYSAVIGWSLDDAASYWTVEPATDIEVTSTVTLDGKYYGTSFVPFQTQAVDGTTAYTVTGDGTTTTAHTIGGDIRKDTPVLLRSDSKTMKLFITDTEAGDDMGCLALRNDYADLSYKYFNRAFLMFSGEGEDNTTYYRTNLAETGHLYFWQQALVILAIEDRYTFRGDRSCASLITDLLDAFITHEGQSWTWNEYNDDLLWAGLAMVRGYLITGEQRFLDKALHAWNLLYERGYDDTLGGGIWWSIKKEEKSGLSNNPAICMASYLYEATGEEKYLDIAKDLYQWVKKTLRKSDGSVAEKVDADGKVSTAYNVYNIGTFIEGAAALYRLTEETVYRTDARKSIEYVMINKVTDKGLLSAWKTNGTWQSEFARGVAFWLRAYPGDWTRSTYYMTGKKATNIYKWLRMNADAAWETRDRVYNITGCKWEETTPTRPSADETWEADACVSAVVMTNVVPQVVPGNEAEEYITLDEKLLPEVSGEVDKEDEFALDEENIMRQPAPTHIVCVGNSITEGYGLSSGMYAWPAQLQNLLGTGYQVHNCGVSGTTMSREAEASYWNTSRYTDAKNADPQILIMALGTNDADNWRWVQYGQDFKKDYLAMVEEFRQNGRNPVIYCVLTPPLFPLDRTQNQNVENYLIPQIKELAEQLDAHVIDYHTSMTGQSANFPDGVHPNATGAGMLAALAEAAVRQGQCLSATLTPSAGKVTADNAVLIQSGSNVAIEVTANEAGVWQWTGPNNFSATTANINLESLTQGGVYRVHFTGESGLSAALSVLVSIEGDNAAAITPYVQVSGASWQQTTTLGVPLGATVNFGPQYKSTTGGTWSWQGPNGFRWVGRSPSIPDMTEEKAGRYACTYTDANGRQSTTIFTIQIQ